MSRSSRIAVITLTDGLPGTGERDGRAYGAPFFGTFDDMRLEIEERELVDVCGEAVETAPAL
jgi:hypothetical protein